MPYRNLNTLISVPRCPALQPTLPMESSYSCHAFAQMACAIITIMMQRYKKDLKQKQLLGKKEKKLLTYLVWGTQVSDKRTEGLG